MAEEQQLTLDLDELRHLQSMAKRPRVISFLASEIRGLDAEFATVTAATAATRRAAVSAEKAPVDSGAVDRSYVTLGSFSWDQDDDKIKIYISIEGADQEKVDAVFKPMSVDIKLHDIHEKNYRFYIPKLNKEILPDKCTLVVKPTKVIVNLVKVSKGNWLDLHFKEDKGILSMLKSNLGKDKDPMAGIMDLMKNMYEEGDDEMKRTIAKAWSDARSGKTADPLKAYP